MKRLAALFAIALSCAVSHAEETDATVTADDPVAMKALAARLQDEARDIRRVAEETQAKAQKACWKQFLVTRCLDEAGQAYRDERLKAASLDNRASAIQRELKRREIADKDAKRAEKEAKQAAKDAARAGSQ